MTSKWVTRERRKIDRIACPWLIRRFVAKEAEFIYVPTEQVFAVAKETGATPYDIPGAEPFSHHVFLRLGTTGFGGPVALVDLVERDLVTEHGWLTC
jgi:hypothetical protein